MKRNTLLLYTLLAIAFVCSSVNTTQIKKLNHSNKQDVTIRPNLSDLKRFVKPLISAPYKPIEVDSLQNPNKQDENLEMTNAEIVGLQQKRRGMNEKPTLYDTIVTPHATSIMHGDQLNNNNIGGFNVNSAMATMFNQSQDEAMRLSGGEIAIPVKLETHSLVNDATLSGYETPLFLSKGQRKVSKKITIPKNIMFSPKLVAKSAADAKKIKNNLTAAKSFRQKKVSLNAERDRLTKETKVITNQIAAQINTLLKAKNIGLKLNQLLEKYTLKMKNDQLRKLKLTDRVQIKNELKAKLLREVEGFRTSGNQFTSVTKLDHSDLLKIVKQIKKKLGN